MDKSLSCRRQSWLIAFAILLLLTACGRAKPSPGAALTDSASTPVADPANLASLVLAVPPDGAVGPARARATAKPGDRIVLVGEVGGRKVGSLDPELAVFYLADPEAVVNCARKHEGPDGCQTPWDYCCEPKDKLLTALALIQVRDPNPGQVLTRSLRGWNGLKELSRVTVVGTVDAASSPAALVVNLEGIYFHPSPVTP